MTRTPLRRFLGALTIALAAAAFLGACGDDDDATSDDADPTAEIEVDGAWARTSPAVATAGAAYLEITNSGDVDDVLTAASVDPSVAATVELHETTMAEDEGPADEGMGDEGAGEGMEPGDDDADAPMGSPMMRMQPVDEIPVPAGTTVVLEPGGLHIMMLDLAAPLEVGTTIELVLTFAEAGDVAVTAEVRDSAP